MQEKCYYFSVYQVCHNLQECSRTYQNRNLPLETWFVKGSVFYCRRSFQYSHLDYRNRGGPRSEGTGVDNIPQILRLPSISSRQKNIPSQNHIPESWCWLINVHTEIDKHNEEKLYKEARGKFWKKKRKNRKARIIRRNDFLRLASTSDEEAVDKTQLWSEENLEDVTFLPNRYNTNDICLFCREFGRNKELWYHSLIYFWIGLCRLQFSTDCSKWGVISLNKFKGIM